MLTISGKNAKYNDLAFSPDGSRLASVTTGQTVNIWDAASGAKQLTLAGSGSALSAVAFSPDGSRLATAAADTTVAVWDLASGKLSRTVSIHSEAVNDIAFSPDGKQLATASSDKTFHFSPLNVEELIGLARSRLTRALTQKECQKYLHVEKCPKIP